MKAGRLLAAALMVMTFGLTACGVAKDQKNAERMVEDGNALITKANEDSSALANSHNISVYGYYVDTADSTWSKRTDNERQDIKIRLTSYIQKMSRVIEIGNHKHMTIIGNKTQMERGLSNARTLLASLEEYQRRTQVQQK